MAAEALRGERVVRLKGGDPFVFGRGGEEADAPARAGIEVEVVNGITAGLAAATVDRRAAHPPRPRPRRRLRHRPCAPTRRGAAPRSTGRRSPPPRPSGLTLVIYMGIATAEALQAGLRDARSPATTPVAIVQHASLPEQRQAICTPRRRSPRRSRASGLGSPAIIVVGDVVRAGVAALAQAGRARRAAPAQAA